MNFSQFLAILGARWKVALGVFIGVVLVALAVSLLTPKKYTAVASVVIESRPDPVAGAVYGAMLNPSLVATQIDIIRSERVAYRVIRALRLTENPAIREQWQAATEGKGSIELWLSQLFSKSLDVRPSRESNVIAIAYEAPDPQFATGMANAFVQAYLDTHLEMRVEPARQYTSFFNDRLKESRDNLDKAQGALSAFQREKGIIANDERLDVENARLSELSSQLVALQAAAVDSGSRQTAARGTSADRMQEVLANPLVAGLKSDQARLEGQQQQLRARLGEQHPQVLEIAAQLTELKRRIDTEVSKVTGSLGVANSINQQRVSELRASLEAQRSKVLQMKAVRDDGSLLLRDVENAQRAYDLLVQRMNQTSLESLTTQGNVSVLTQALLPSEPTSPRVVLNMLVAVFGGVLLGVAVVIIMELLDRRIRGTDDLAQVLGLPLVGVVPPTQAKRRLWRRGSVADLPTRIVSGAPSN
jgi:polysaccharide biosynthesis transport protein